jgi:hypothetical protein
MRLTENCTLDWRALVLLQYSILHVTQRAWSYNLGTCYILDATQGHSNSITCYSQQIDTDSRILLLSGFRAP